MRVNVTVDGIGAVVDGLSAWRASLDRTGRGTVLTAKRLQLPGMPSGRQAHGRAIANFLMDKGHDPFSFPADIEGQVEDQLADQITAALEQAYARGTVERDQVKAALTRAAEQLATWARDNILAGKLGENKGKYWRYKRAMSLAAEKGFTAKYGVPPPYGVASGQFAEGFKGGWELGPTGGGD